MSGLLEQFDIKTVILIVAFIVVLLILLAILVVNLIKMNEEDDLDEYYENNPGDLDHPGDLEISKIKVSEDEIKPGKKVKTVKKEKKTKKENDYKSALDDLFGESENEYSDETEEEEEEEFFLENHEEESELEDSDSFENKDNSDNDSLDTEISDNENSYEDNLAVDNSEEIIYEEESDEEDDDDEDDMPASDNYYERLRQAEEAQAKEKGLLFRNEKGETEEIDWSEIETTLKESQVSLKKGTPETENAEISKLAVKSEVNVENKANRDLLFGAFSEEEINKAKENGNAPGVTVKKRAPLEVLRNIPANDNNARVQPRPVKQVDIDEDDFEYGFLKFDDED